MSNAQIKNLAKDLAPWKQMDSLPVFFLKWSLLSLAFFGLNAFWMPWRFDINLMIQSQTFIIENFLWIVLTVSSAFALYESVFPQNDTKIHARISLILLMLLMLLAFKNHDHSLAHQWGIEMSWWRGRCGIIITLFAILETPILVMWAKNGAPKSPGLTGAYAALTSASLGCLLMQVVCFHPNSLHLLIWHFLPLFLMSWTGYAVAKKILRW